MTRDEQMEAIGQWWFERPGAWWAANIVDHFPAFMEKCAEVGLCEEVVDPVQPRRAYYVLVRPHEHEHEWRVSEIGWRPWTGNDEATVRVVCECGTRRDVPNRLPLTAPS